MSGGPVQLMAFGYGSALGAEERIMAELDSLQGRGLLRLLDFLFVQKSAEGDLTMIDVGDDDDYGTILAGFFPWDDEDGTAAAEADIDPDELTELADALDPGTAMALVLVEHTWAGGLFSAVEESGGEMLSEGFITDEGQIVLGSEVEALSEAAAAIEEAHAVETAARLDALRAIDEAVATVEKAQRIRDSAAAAAVAALVEAGIIEANAADEAADALIEAGVIARAAGEVAEAAIVQEEAAVEDAEQVVADAGIREAAAIEEVEATEDLAARLEAAATLTPAEKKLLRYFKTDLTFAMIADKLGASRGAVKDRASRIYKKLGVHSREEAAAAAIELGLLKA